MALPALRQPKFLAAAQKKAITTNFSDVNYLVLTLKNEMKLVIASDAYHGIVTEDHTYRCVFCQISMEFDQKYKEIHKDSVKHQTTMNGVPYIEEFAEHLFRKISKDYSYCTICNVTLPSYSVARHLLKESHSLEYERAIARASTYKPEFDMQMM